MDPQIIVATAESGAFPANWHVWTLRRGKVWREVAWQAFISAFGFFLLIWGLAVTIPDSFTQSSLKAVGTIALLLLFAIMGFGGFALVGGELNRLRLAGRYLLVMTPDDFVKRSPHSVIHVPMEHVTDIRLVGVKVSNNPDGGLPRTGRRSIERLSPALFHGATFFLRRPRQQPRLSFVDDRDDKRVVVSQDHAFDDLGALEYILRIYVGDKERELLRAARSRQ